MFACASKRICPNGMKRTVDATLASALISRPIDEIQREGEARCVGFY
jgi:hypothetical protein